LDDDRLEESDDELLSQLLLEFLPFTPWESLFTLNPIKASFFNMRTSKLTTKFKAASKMRWRKDFCFAAPSHSKGLKLSTYRLMNTEAQQFVPVTYNVVLTNTSSATLEFEVSTSSASAVSPNITKSEIFVSFAPSAGILGAGKSVTIKVTAVLLEEVQFFKFFRIQAFWLDLQYASFIPLMLAQTCSSAAPSTVTVKEMSAAMSNLSSPGALEEAKRKFVFKYPKHSPLHLDPASLTKVEFDSSGGFTSALPQKLKDAYWKIPFEDLKLLKRLGGTQASVSLCSLYGADVVLKKWDIGSLDPVPDEFVAELEALRTLCHPNLVQFLGGQSAKGVAFLVTEYVPKGTLSELLQNGDLRRRPKGPLLVRNISNPSPSVNYSAQASLHPSMGNYSSHNIGTSSSSSSSSASTSKFVLGTSPTSQSPISAAMASSSSNHNNSGSSHGMYHPQRATSTFVSPRSSAESSSGSSPPSLIPTAPSIPSMHNSSNPWMHSSPSTAIKLKIGIAADVASAMAYMHYHRRMHRDLKSLNILVDEAYRGKVADLGSSKNWSHATQMTVGVGSFDWIAPEVLNSRNYSVAADVFSFGLILWELVHEKFPDRPMDMVAKGQIPSVDPEKLVLLFRDPSSPAAIEFINLINRCCDSNPQTRPSFADIVIVLEQILSNPNTSSSSSTNTTPRYSSSSTTTNTTATTTQSSSLATTNHTSTSTSSPSPSAATTSVSQSSDTIADNIKRSAGSSADAWVKALKSSTSSSSSLYLQQQQSPTSSPMSNASPLSSPQLSPVHTPPSAMSGSPESPSESRGPLVNIDVPSRHASDPTAKPTGHLPW
jgi:serine/threonine protein kinase